MSAPVPHTWHCCDRWMYQAPSVGWLEPQPHVVGRLGAWSQCCRTGPRCSFVIAVSIVQFNLAFEVILPGVMLA